MMNATNLNGKRMVTGLCVGLLLLRCSLVCAVDSPLKVLLINGQNNHNWVETSPVIEGILESTGRFQVDVSTCPPALPRKPRLKREDANNPEKRSDYQTALKRWENELAVARPKNEAAWRTWHPNFHHYDVIVSNYNGQAWPRAIERHFETYMIDGGGLVVIHAADNAFSQWTEYNKMIGVAGWGGRNEKSGPMLRYRDGRWVRDSSPGRGGTHGRQIAALVVCHEPDHPIMQGLPLRWLHVKDEIYGKLRGPAENLTVLASSFSDTRDGGTGEQEPGLMVIDYYQGRVFHTIYGHAAQQMKGLGFQITLQRGTEWAATGHVNLPLPEKKLSQTEAVLAD